MATAAEIWAFNGAGQALAAAQADGGEVHAIHGLDAAKPLAVAQATRTVGAITQSVGETSTAVVVARVP